MALNFQLQFLTSRKRFGGLKTIPTLERARKNLSVYVLYFFLRESAYDYERVKYSVFYAKKNVPRDPAGPVLMADAPIMHTYMCDPCGARHCLCSCWPAKSGETSARLG